MDPRHVGGVNSAREQDSSVGGGTRNNCLGVVHMEGVQDRVQGEVSREQPGEGKRGTEKQRETINRSPWMAWRWNDAPCGVIHIIRCVQCA